jgi:hypothetical protein
LKQIQFFAAGVLLLFASSAHVSAADDIRQEQIQFKKGASSATLTGRIKGYQAVDYQLRAGAGQTMTVTFKPSNPSAYFNVLPPGTEEAIFVGSSSGNRCEAELPADGVYTIRVYLMRNAARRNETTNYTLEVGVAGKAASSAAPQPAPAAAAPFDRALELQGIRFHVTSANDGSVNTLRIVPTGLAIDNSPIERTVEGRVTGAEVADLNADGSPEVYVYVASADSGARGSLVAYSSNQRKSLSEIYLPPIAEDQAAYKGYRGRDEYAVLEGVLGHRFPVYRDADTDGRPTGGMRQLQYTLVPGEAGWLLKKDRMVDF